MILSQDEQGLECRISIFHLRQIDGSVLGISTSLFRAEFSLRTELRERIAECLRLTTSGIDVVLRHDAPDFFLQEVSGISKTRRYP